MTAKNMRGIPFLRQSTENESDITDLQNYYSLLQAIQLPEENLKTLLSAYNVDGQPLLYNLLVEGKTKAIHAYGQILAGLTLSNETKIALLSMQAQDGEYLESVARLYAEILGHQATMQSYTRAVHANGFHYST